jgi:hypothetical protein
VTLVEFLRARMAQDEAIARSATPGPWRYNPRKEWYTDPDKLMAARAGMWQAGGEEFVGAGPLTATVGVAATGPSDHPQSMTDAQHIARHDPARVLRQAEALRRIVDDCAQIIGESSSASPEYGLAVAILKNVAAVDADHKDYQPEWRPE